MRRIIGVIACGAVLFVALVANASLIGGLQGGGSGSGWSSLLDCSSVIGSGLGCYDTDNKTFCIGDGDSCDTVAGTQGPQGETGADGANGATWYFSATDPGADCNGTAGTNGDVCLNTVTGDYFQKSGGAWPGTASGSLLGPQGPQGNPGADGADGAGITSNSDCSGITSGTCLDTDDGKLYCWNGSAVEECGAGDWQSSDSALTTLASKVWAASGTIGGTAGMLDAIPVASIADGDIAIVSTTGGKTQVYYYESSSSADEADNSVVKPDDNAGNGRWLIQLWIESGGIIQISSLNLPSSNADPSAVAGQIRHDSTVSNHANGAVRWHDGTNIRQMVDMVAATAEGCGSGNSVVYNATSDLFECAARANATSTQTWTEVQTHTANISSSAYITGLMPPVVLTIASGVHDGSNDQATMTDSGESFTTNQFVGMTLYNITDGSSCTVTENNGTSITCTLAGGTQNDWDTNDVWQVGPGPYQSGSWFYVVAASTIRHPATVGYVVCYESDATAVLTIDMASNSMIFQGVLDTAVVALDAGDSIDSSGSTTGDNMCIHNKSATEAQGKGKRGTWVDGGAS